MKLGSYPKAGRPLSIDRLIIDSPSVTLASRTAAPAASAGAATDSPPVAGKSVDIRLARLHQRQFRIRELRITGGVICLVESGVRAVRPRSHQRLRVTVARLGAALQFSIAADQAASAQVLLGGAISLDDFVLGLTEVSIQAKAGADSSEIPLEPSIRRRLAECKMQATLDVHGSASVPLHDWKHASFQADVQLRGGAALLPGVQQMHIDDAEADIHLQGSSGTRGIQGELRKLVARAGGTLLCIDDARFSTAADGQSWRPGGSYAAGCDVNSGVSPQPTTANCTAASSSPAPPAARSGFP